VRLSPRRPAVPRRVTWLPIVLLACAAILAAAAAVAIAAGPRPPIVKACGGIHGKGKRQRVDIDEARGDVPRSCASARAVMRRFLRRAGSYDGPNTTEIILRRRTFDCYVSRPDGEGWDCHCSWFSADGKSLIDYGAGRRF
jgi:hypothetical protein